MPGAGKLDRRIRIERFQVVGTNALNEDVLDWAELATVWAQRKDVSDGEKFAANQIAGFLSSRFIIRSSTVTRTTRPSDRIVHDGRVWNLKGIKETSEGRLRFLELTAVANIDGS